MYRISICDDEQEVLLLLKDKITLIRGIERATNLLFMQVCGVSLFKKQQFYDILVSRKSVVGGKNENDD